jgi:hypothetical protein
VSEGPYRTPADGGEVPPIKSLVERDHSSELQVDALLTVAKISELSKHLWYSEHSIESQFTDSYPKQDPLSDAYSKRLVATKIVFANLREILNQAARDLLDAANT